MQNLQDQIQKARALEHSGGLEPALEAYARLSATDGPHLEDPAFWLHLGRLADQLDRPDHAAAGYDRAAELLHGSGQPNNALAVLRRRFEAAPDESVQLRMAAIAAAQGYAREASEGYLSYARAVGSDELPVEVVVRELREGWLQLSRHGAREEADALRARIRELRPDADPALDLADQVRPARAPAPAREPDVHTRPAEAPGDASPEAPAADAREVAPLEGLEPTHAGAEWASPPATEENDLPLLDTRLGGDEASEPTADEDSEAEIPLLGSAPPPSVAPERSAAADAADSARDVPTDALTDELAEAPTEAPTAEDPAEPAPRAAEPAPGKSSAPAVEPDRSDDYVDLGALILDEEEEASTRFQTDAVGEPTGDDAQDFEEILGAFREQVSRKIHPQDSSSHYDLGVAFKEMGLLDDAIGQLQKALQGGADPLATLEVLGECFVEKGEHSLACRVLDRALRLEGASESELLGVHYWLGRCQENMGRSADAAGYYERVVSVDIGFRDAASRLTELRGRAAGSR